MKSQSMFKLKRPCAKCPFRTDVPGFLHRERAASIAREVAGGSIMHCHQTTVYVEEWDGGGGDMASTADSQFCAGALILMEKAQAPNQAMRMAERIGLYDPTVLEMEAPVHPSFIHFVKHHGDDEAEDAECCSVVNGGCLAPAGYLIGGAAVPAEAEGEVHECPGCGNPVCEACSNEAGFCFYCADEEPDD